MKKQKNKNRGFTLVEVLICVGIIGIIAAITIPVLLTSTSEKALDAQRRALYSRMAQAFGQIKNLKLYEQSTVTGSGASATYTDVSSALTFITDGLSKVYKLSNTCDAASLRECGIPDIVYDYYSETASTNYEITDKADLNAYNSNIATTTDLGNLQANFAAFKTANGESVLLWYNPKCKAKNETSPHNFADSVCVNMIYDLNGKNGAPNAYGEDIGYITVFYPADPTVVMPMVFNEYSATSGIYTGTYNDMLAKATELSLAPPTIEEITAILVNKNLTKVTKDKSSTDSFWSSSYDSSGTGKIWSVSQQALGVETKAKDSELNYVLIKK